MSDFIKMHGLGNDFVIFDWRHTNRDMPADAARLIADRRRGIGCDQIMILRAPNSGPHFGKNKDSDLFLEMLNADGSHAGACGNGTRCVADLMMREAGTDRLMIETVSGDLACWRVGYDNVPGHIIEGGQTIENSEAISVDMGAPGLRWQDIPLAQDADTQSVLLDDNLPPAVCVSMGNPHAVLFFEDVAGLDIAALGRDLEVHQLFPERANIEFVSKLSDNHFRMRVWERGAGITDACGSGACAVAVAAIQRGLAGRDVRITLDGGDLYLSWPEDGPHAGHVIMTGPVSYVAQGNLSQDILDQFPQLLSG